MWRRLIVVVVFLSALSGLIAQDLVVTNTLDSIECKIVKISGDTFLITFIEDDVEKSETILRSKISYFSVDYKNQTPEIQPPVESPNFRKVRISLSGGPANLMAEAPNNIPREYIPYVEALKSGNYLGAEISFYENDKIGMGFKYSLFKTSNQLENVSFVDSTGTTIYGLLEDDITIQYIGPALAIRRTLPTGSAYFISNISVGMLSYLNKATVIDKITIKGKTFAFAADIGLDFQIVDGLYFGLGVGVTFGVLKELTVETQGVSETLNLSDLEYSNASHVDLGIGLRYYW